MAKGIMAAPVKVFSFFKESRDELKKVAWPTRETTVRYTLIVITASVVVGLLIGGLDLVFNKLLQLFIL